MSTLLWAADVTLTSKIVVRGEYSEDCIFLCDNDTVMSAYQNAMAGPFTFVSPINIAPPTENLVVKQEDPVSIAGLFMKVMIDNYYVESTTFYGTGYADEEDGDEVVPPDAIDGPGEGLKMVATLPKSKFDFDPPEQGTKSLAKEWDESKHPRGAGGRFGEGGGDGAKPDGQSQDRPSVGNFQFNAKECEHLAEVYQKAADEAVVPDPLVGHESMQSMSNEERQAVWSKNAGEQASSTEMARMLGYDGPAKIEEDPYNRMDEEGRPNLFRGCDEAGVAAMTSDLTTFNGSGESLLGPGIYTSANVRIANEFANKEQSGGYRVGMWADKNMKIADASNRALWTNPTINTSGWSPQALKGLELTQATPTQQALSHGFQALNAEDITAQDATVVFDRSALTINVEKIDHF